MSYPGFPPKVRFTPVPDPMFGPLLEQIEDVEFTYYGYNLQSERSEWRSDWIGEEMLGVPQAMKISYDESHLIVPINASFSGTLRRR